MRFFRELIEKLAERGRCRSPYEIHNRCGDGIFEVVEVAVLLMRFLIYNRYSDGVFEVVELPFSL